MNLDEGRKAVRLAREAVEKWVSARERPES